MYGALDAAIFENTVRRGWFNDVLAVYCLTRLYFK